MAVAISSLAPTAQAGNPGAPTMEPEIAPAEDTFVPPQGSVNGGYIVLGTLLLMVLGASGI